MNKTRISGLAALLLAAAVAVPFARAADAPDGSSPTAPVASTEGTKYLVETFEDTPGYRAPGSGEPTGTLKAGPENYVFCRVQGPEVRRGNDHNSWWLLTDLDSGSPWKNQYVSAFALARWSNDEARANDGTEIPECPDASGGAGEGEVSDTTARTLDVQWEQQTTDYTCGPTTVRMLLGLHGATPTIDELSTAGKTTKGAGTNRDGVVNALNQFQKAHEYQISIPNHAPVPADRNMRAALLNDVKGAIKQGHGVALAFNGRMPGYRWDADHWVAIVGLDGDKVLIADPVSGKGTGANLAPTYWVAINDLPIKTWVY